MTEFKMGETVLIECRSHSREKRDGIIQEKKPRWLEAEFIKYNGTRVWVMTKTSAGLRKQSIAPSKVRKKDAG